MLFKYLFASVFLIINLMFIQASVLVKDCKRNCDTHFSGNECWQRTFKYFISDFVDQMKQYSEVIDNIKSHPNGDKLIEKLQENRDSIIKELIQEFEFDGKKDDVDSFAEFRPSIYDLNDYLKNIESTKIYTKTKLNRNNLIECPKQTCNNEESNTNDETNIYKYIVFIGIPSLLTFILAFIIFFVLFELKVVKVYKR